MGLGRGFRGGMGSAMRSGFCKAYAWNPNPYVPSYSHAMDTAEELNLLKAQAASMKSVLDAISKRMVELEKSPE
jgi:hypothetical protein